MPKPVPLLWQVISRYARQGALQVCLSWWEAHLHPQHRCTFVLELLLFPFKDAREGPRSPFSAQVRDKAQSKRRQVFAKLSNAGGKADKFGGTEPFLSSLHREGLEKPK